MVVRLLVFLERSARVPPTVFGAGFLLQGLRMSRLPISLNRHIGLAMHHLLRTGQPATNAELRAILRTSGPTSPYRSLRDADPVTDTEISQIIRAARSNVTATQRAKNATAGQSVRAACDYKCPEDTIIGIRVRFSVNNPQTGETREVSTVVNVPARSNLLDAVRLAQQSYQAQQTRFGARSGVGFNIVDAPSVEMIDSVSLGGFEGGVLVY